MQAPKTGAPRAIGGYSAGCIAGAVELPKGMHIARPERKRIYGHPPLIAFLKSLSANKNIAPVWLGDLSQPRGGPAPSGHASHQTGLDVDIFYARDKGEALPMVDLEAHKTTKHFTAKVVKLIREAAQDPAVERLFVNPVLKQALCDKYPGEWLHKVRPWWGHHDHFHARLPCPADSSDCKPQDPIAAGDGCADMPWWLSPEAQADRKKEQEKYQSKVGALPELPEGCKQVLEN